jgi:predicted metal-binding membrane protein
MTLIERRTRPTRDTIVVSGSVGALAAAALAVLAWWPAPGGHHHGSGALGVAGYIAMWLAMVIAMMLPTSTPMVLALHRLGRDRRGRATVLGGAGIGYLAVWAMAGVVAAVADLGARSALEDVARMPAMTAGTPMGPDPRADALARTVGGLVVLLAGVMALTPLTTRCLRACQSPVGFVARHWNGSGDRWRQAIRIGASYGVSCLGCCAALMTVLVLFGMQDLLLMLGLAAVMAWQKHARYGIVVARIAGGAMILGGGIAALTFTSIAVTARSRKLTTSNGAGAASGIHSSALRTPPPIKFAGSVPTSVSRRAAASAHQAKG